MSNRSLRYYLPSYLRTLRAFRNGIELAHAHYTVDRVRRPECATFWDGQKVHNVDHRPAFADTIVELWGLLPYTCDGFYSPMNDHVVLDLGANIGLFSVWVARQAPSAKVVAVELSSENYEVARRNLDGWAHNVSLHHAGIGRTSGTGYLAVVGERTLDHRLAATAGGVGSEKVDVITLEGAVNMAEARMIDLIKMDIEGGEVDAFEGASPALLRKFRRIALEFHNHIRPGARTRLEELLSETHIVVSADDGDYGILRAKLRSDVSA